MHSQLAKQNQNFFDSRYEIFVAEVASTVNEELLTRHLVQEAEGEIRRHALSHSLESFRTTLFRQAMFAEFEHRAYRKMEERMAITADEATELYGEIKEEFYRPAEVDERIRQEWMRIPHFYYNFYVFKYSTGISAANRIVDLVLEDGPESYLDMLRAGGSDYPLEILDIAGVDMRSPEPVESAVQRYRKRQQRIEEAL
jgi:oligoendopeptidase F